MADGACVEPREKHCASVEIGEHRYGVVTHDGKPHVLGNVINGVHLPAQADIPEGYGVIRDSSARVVLVADSGTSP